MSKLENLDNKTEEEIKNILKKYLENNLEKEIILKTTTI